jgi:hypothetical protein
MKTRRVRKRRPRWTSFWHGHRWRQHWQRALQRSPGAVKAIVATAVVFTLALAVNWIYQVVGKPSELLFPVSGTLYKTPSETWRQYGSIFRRYSTRSITSDFLAAVAQIESSGNPVVRTYWRWTWTTHPLQMYRPASSAVGMYQITDATFAEASRYCIHDHTVAQAGPTNRWHSCWFNGLYTRLSPGDAVELTSAYLDRNVAISLDRHGIHSATLRQRQRLAAVIHLCGATAGDDYARRRFKLLAGQRCGDHDVSKYLARVEAMKLVFARLAANSSNALVAQNTVTAR